MTALLWAPASIAASRREWDSPRVFFFNLGLAETAHHRAEVAGQNSEQPAVTRRAGLCNRLLAETNLLVPAEPGEEREQAERVGLGEGRAGRARARQPFLEQTQRHLIVALLRGEQSRPHDGGRPGLRRFNRSLLERGDQQLAAFPVMTADEPEPRKGSD